MRSYTDIKASFPEIPYKSRGDFTAYFGYTKGAVLGSFPSKQAAIDAGATTTEKNIDEDGYRAWQAEYRNFNDRVMAAFQKEVRDQYPEMSDAMFNHIWQAAYDHGHNAGHDEVAAYFDTFYDFAMKVVEISK